MFQQSIADVILDSCLNDKRTLLTCALVNKSWAAASRSRMFSTVHLNGSTVENFAVLMNERFTIGTFVQRLVLYTTDSLELFARFTPVLDQYIHPRSLELHIWNVPKWPQEYGEAGDYQPVDISFFHRRFRNVVDLHGVIHCGSFRDVGELIGTGSFPYLEALTLTASWYYEDEMFPESVNDLVLSPCLKSISLPQIPPSFFAWLIDQKSSVRPCSLAVDVQPGYQPPILGAYIEELDRDLKQLKLAASLSYALLTGEIKLQHSSDLRSLFIQVWDRPATVVHHLLSGLSSSVIEAIEFTAWSPDTDEDGSWSNVDDLLSGPRFPSIRQVTVSINPDNRALLDERLPKTRICRHVRYRSQTEEIYY